MRIIATLTFAALLMVSAAGHSVACSHDILCPDGWFWSDKEGTCVEAPMPTT